MSARIVSTPFVYPDGGIQVNDQTFENVEIDGLWVHVVTYDSLGNRAVHTSFPAHEVQRIEWVHESNEVAASPQPEKRDDLATEGSESR